MSIRKRRELMKHIFFTTLMVLLFTCIGYASTNGEFVQYASNISYNKVQYYDKYGRPVPPPPVYYDKYGRPAPPPRPAPSYNVEVRPAPPPPPKNHVVVRPAPAPTYNVEVRPAPPPPPKR